jgi:hypothetical protein
MSPSTGATPPDQFAVLLQVVLSEGSIVTSWLVQDSVDWANTAGPHAAVPTAIAKEAERKTRWGIDLRRMTLIPVRKERRRQDRVLQRSKGK